MVSRLNSIFYDPLAQLTFPQGYVVLVIEI